MPSEACGSIVRTDMSGADAVLVLSSRLAESIESIIQLLIALLSIYPYIMDAIRDWCASSAPLLTGELLVKFPITSKRFN